MSFNNFYEESDKTSWRRWGIAALVISLLILQGLMCEFFRQTPESVEQAITTSETLSRVNKLCEELPKPEGFKFVSKSLGGNSEISALSFNYQTERKYEEIKAFYLSLLPSKGWIIDDSRDLGFKKDNKFISIGRDYIYCGEKRYNK